MKSVLISIKPKYCELIANGKKTIEIRKTKPRIDTPFKCYIYCTKGDLNIYSDGKQYVTDCLNLLNNNAKESFEKTSNFRKWNGKVIGEFVCDKITEFYPTMDLNRLTSNHIQMVDKSCVNMRDLYNYANDKILYAWQISDIVIYDKPKELNEFKMNRSPQSWCYVKEESNENN